MERISASKHPPEQQAARLLLQPQKLEWVFKLQHALQPLHESEVMLTVEYVRYRARA